MISGYNKLNVGASIDDMVDGWLNITWWGIPFDDMINKEVEGYEIYKSKNGVDVLNYDVTKGLPFEDNSINYIYSSHFIEHLTFEESIEFFKECKRILRKDGIIRIICPDLEKWINSYIKNDQQFFDKYKQQITIDSPDNYLYYLLDRITTKGQIMCSNFYNWDHKWMWDFESMELVLKDIGFNEIQKSSSLVSDIPEVESVEAPSIELFGKRILESLYVEAVKL
jgi:predicted SAM-dependent methyltransferase